MRLSRTLAVESYGVMGGHCTAYIETRGPKWLGPPLYRHRLRQLPYCFPNWLTLDPHHTEQRGRFAHRWQVHYERVYR